MFLFKPCFIVRPLSTIETTLVGWRWGGGVEGHHWLGSWEAAPTTLALNLSALLAAESLQSCSTLCNPIGGSPPGSPIPGILQARTQEWVVISFSSA